MRWMMKNGGAMPQTDKEWESAWTSSMAPAQYGGMGKQASAADYTVVDHIYGLVLAARGFTKIANMEKQAAPQSPMSMSVGNPIKGSGAAGPGRATPGTTSPAPTSPNAPVKTPPQPAQPGQPMGLTGALLGANNALSTPTPDARARLKALIQQMQGQNSLPGILDKAPPQAPQQYVKGDMMLNSMKDAVGKSQLFSGAR